VSAEAEARALLSRWWIAYDEADFEAWPALVAAEITFSSRSDSGAAPNEAQLAGRAEGAQEFLAWQKQHRLLGPFPLRHQVTNFFLASEGGDGRVEYRSTLMVTKVGESGIVLMSSGSVSGSVVLRDGSYRLAGLHVVLDKTPSRPLREILAERAGT
jgi:hypothetical protein